VADAISGLSAGTGFVLLIYSTEVDFPFSTRMYPVEITSIPELFIIGADAT